MKTGIDSPIGKCKLRLRWGGWSGHAAMSVNGQDRVSQQNQLIRNAVFSDTHTLHYMCMCCSGGRIQILNSGKSGNTTRLKYPITSPAFQRLLK